MYWLCLWLDSFSITTLWSPMSIEGSSFPSVLPFLRSAPLLIPSILRRRRNYRYLFHRWHQQELQDHGSTFFFSWCTHPRFSPSPACLLRYCLLLVVVSITFIYSWYRTATISPLSHASMKSFESFEQSNRSHFSPQSHYLSCPYPITLYFMVT